MYSLRLRDLNVFNLFLVFTEIRVELEFETYGNLYLFLVLFWRFFDFKKKSIGEYFDWGVKFIQWCQNGSRNREDWTSAGYYLKCIIMEKMGRLYKTLKNK